MQKTRFIVTSFAYGTGPYLRTTEWALAVNDILAARGQERHGIIVPLLYGNKQRLIMQENFGSNEELILDEKFGELLSPLLFCNETYEQYLRRWAGSVEETGKLIRKYLMEHYGNAIALELHRSPRCHIGIAPACAVTFAWQRDILAASMEMPEIPLPSKLLKDAVALFAPIETAFALRMVTEPGTFTDAKAVAGRDLIPPTIGAHVPDSREIAPGMYCTVTGIPGLENLLQEASRFGMIVYCNDPSSLPGARRASPSLLGNPAIEFHFARSGWSSVWLSLLTNTPFVAAPWDSRDDPEIFFNNRRIEELGIGIVYRGENLEELREKTQALKPAMQTYREQLVRRFGTLDGTRLAAEKTFDKVFASAG